MSWLYYLLEANLYLILFYGFYRLFLQKETFYGLNRYYLIFSSTLAFLLPFFQLGFLKTPVIEQITIEPTETINQVMVTSNLPIENYQPSIFTVDNAMIAIYALVTIALLFKMFFGLSKIIRMLKLPSVKLENGVKLIDLKDSKIAFSFFNMLFLDPALPEKNTILKHELVHIKQKHSFDVLLFEMIQIINWFNPITYLVKKDIKLIHEYLADEETTRCDVEKYQYAMFLIQNSTGIQNLTLTNQIFSSSILKKRISMLNQKKSASWARLKLLLALPITVGMLCISTVAFTKDYGFVELGSSLKLQSSKQDTIKKADKKRLPAPLVIEPRPSVKQKKLSKRVDQIKFPPPVVKPDKRSVPSIRIERDTTKKKKIQEVTVQAYRAAMEAKTVQGYPMDAKDKTIEIKSTPQSDKHLKEVTIKAYEKAMGIKSDSDVKEIKIKENNPPKVEEKKTPKLVLEIHQDEIIKSKNDRLTANIPEGATAELTVYNATYDKAFYKSADYKNEWNAKELPDGKYPYNFVFRKNGKVVGGKSGFVQVK
jgi:beta-lactamase regulating signal transducer with metallopeptidase domain